MTARAAFNALDVLGIFIDCFAVGECSAASDVVSLVCSAGGNCDDPSQPIVLPELDSHPYPYVNERNTRFLRTVNDQPPAGAPVDANEDEAHSFSCSMVTSSMKQL